MLRDLQKVANELDRMSLTKEANQIDNVLKRVAVDFDSMSLEDLRGLEEQVEEDIKDKEEEVHEEYELSAREKAYEEEGQGLPFVWKGQVRNKGPRPSETHTWKSRKVPSQYMRHMESSMLKTLKKMADKLDLLGLRKEADAVDSVLTSLADKMGPVSTEKHWKVDIHDDPYMSNLTLKDTKMYGSKEEAEKAKKEYEEDGFHVSVEESGFHHSEDDKDKRREEESYFGFEELEDKEKWESSIGEAGQPLDLDVEKRTAPFYEDEEQLMGGMHE